MKKIIFLIISLFAIVNTYGQCDNYKVHDSDDFERGKQAVLSSFINYQQLGYFKHLPKPSLSSTISSMGFIDNSTNKLSLFKKECGKNVQYMVFLNDEMMSRDIVYVTTDSKKYDQLMYEIMSLVRLEKADKNTLNNRVFTINQIVEAWSIINKEGRKIGNLCKGVTDENNITYTLYIF